MGITNDSMLAFSKCADLLESSLCFFKTNGIVSFFFKNKTTSKSYKNDRTKTSVLLIKYIFLINIFNKPLYACVLIHSSLYKQ